MDREKFERIKIIDKKIKDLNFFMNYFFSENIGIRKYKFSFFKKNLFNEAEYFPTEETVKKIKKLLMQELKQLEKERGF